MQRFRQYPYFISASVHILKQLDFPAVTICNASPLNRSKIIKDPRDDNYYLSISPHMDFLADEINWNDSYYEDNGYFKPRSFKDVENDSLDMRSFIKFAMFDRHITKHFTPIVTQFGMCYTWNKKGKKRTEARGASFNLNIYLDINRDSNMHSSEGIKVLVHDPTDHPEIENKGFLVPPGHQASATLTKTRYIFLPKPYKAFDQDYCVDTNDDRFQNPVHPHNYSVIRCRRKCIAEKVYRKCGCIHVGDIGSYPYCSHYRFKTCYIPTMRYLEHHFTSEDRCKCPQPCRHTDYKVDVSYMVFPSDYAANKWIKSGYSKKRKLENATKEYLKNNIIHLQIYFEELKYQEMVQVPEFGSMGDVFSNIGGQMGLFIGASLLTVSEILEFLFFVGIYFVKKLFKCRVSTEETNNNNNQ